MRSGRCIHVVSCHAEGEVGDVIVGGVGNARGRWKVTLNCVISC